MSISTEDENTVASVELMPNFLLKPLKYIKALLGLVQDIYVRKSQNFIDMVFDH